jgi:hypothetical protein
MKIPANVYLSEEQLVELQQEHLIGWVQYVELHSEEMKNDYREYCMVNHLDRKAEQSAILFLQHIEHLL